ncbi:MAG: DedA family protein [Microbacterium sp.]
MFVTEAATASSGWLQTLVDWVVGFMDVIGPYGAGLAIAMENLFPPIPSEAILPLAGLAAYQGAFPLWQAIVWTTVGSLVGALVLYGIGAAVGLKRMRWLFDKIPLLKVSDVDAAVRFFDKHGGKAVFFGRFLPIFRSLISIPAGIVRMPLWRFGLFTAGGSVIWNTVFILIGWFLGTQWHIVERYMDVAEKVVIVAVVIVVVVFVAIRLRGVLRERRATQVDAE